jgi:hypothetical protein
VVSGGQQDAERSLLEYLKPKQEDRFSKLEAFCDLLSRASNGASSCMCADKKVDLLPGQFVATVSDLARTWQWQRATVRQFLEGLVTLGQVHMEPFVKSYVFTVNQSKRMSFDIQDADDVLDFCIMQFSRYTSGHLPAEEVANAFDNYFDMRAEIAANSESPSREMISVLQGQTQVFSHLVICLLEKSEGQKPVAKSVIDASRLLFGREGLWKWQNVLSCLDILSAAFAEQTPPSSISRLHNLHSEAELSLMDSIYTSYKEPSDNPDQAQQSVPASERQDTPSLGEVASDGVNNASPALNKVKPGADAQPSRPGNAGLQY